MRDRAAREGCRLSRLADPRQKEESVYADEIRPREHGHAGVHPPLAGNGREAVCGTESDRVLRSRFDSLLSDALPALTAAFDDGVAVYNGSVGIHPTAAGRAAIARALLPAVRGRRSRSPPGAARGSRAGTGAGQSCSKAAS